jgi:hypothetical protein
MQMLDTPRHTDERSLGDALSAAFAIARGQADAVVRAVTEELTWRVQRNTLSRGGLADLVEILGRNHAGNLSGNGLVRDEAARAGGNAILAMLLGSKDASRALASRAARRSGLGAQKVGAMLPYLAVMAMADLALRARGGLGVILSQVPPMGRLSRGDPHADLAGILRRGCGAGCYSPRALPRVVRRAIAQAGGFRAGGVVVWYARFIVGRTGARVVRVLAGKKIPRSSP